MHRCEAANAVRVPVPPAVEWALSTGLSIKKDCTSRKNVGSGELVYVEADERPEVHGRKSISILLTFSRKRAT